MARKNAEIELLRQNSSAQQSRYESEQRNFQVQRAVLQRDMEANRTELVLTVERSQTETELLRAQIQRLTMQLRAPPPETNRIQVRITKITSFITTVFLAHFLPPPSAIYSP